MNEKYLSIEPPYPDQTVPVPPQHLGLSGYNAAQHHRVINHQIATT